MGNSNSRTFNGTSPGSDSILGIRPVPGENTPFYFRVGNNAEFANRAIFLNCWNADEKSYEMSFDYTLESQSQPGEFTSQINIGPYWVRVYKTPYSTFQNPDLYYDVSHPDVVSVQSFNDQGNFIGVEYSSRLTYRITISFGSSGSTLLSVGFIASGIARGIDGYAIYSLFASLRLDYAEDKSLGPPAPAPAPALMTFPSNTCPRIHVFASSETMYGENLVPSVFRVKDGSTTRSYIRRPGLPSVMRGEGCTFSDKVYYWNMRINGGTKDLTNGILTWGMVRYFLWFLSKGKWCVKIIESKYDKTFKRSVVESNYACWLPYLAQFSGYAKYYK